MTGSCRITVRVTPRGGRDAIESWDGEVLRVRVAAAPADGKANEAVEQLLARVLGVPPSAVRVASGGRGRTKVMEVAGLGAEAARSRLDARDA